jgi:hypothetical protein
VSGNNCVSGHIDDGRSRTIVGGGGILHNVDVKDKKHMFRPKRKSPTS